MNARRTLLGYVLVVAWLVGCGTTMPRPDATASVPPEEWQACTSPKGYSIGVPPAWFVHPPDPAAQVDECTLFAEQPFTATRDEGGAWLGPQVVVMTIDGCWGSFDVASSERELRIQGFPAWAREVAVGEGPNAGEVFAYEYFINLAPNRPCETGRAIFLRTERGAPGDHADNKSVLDQMVSTLRFANAE